MILLREGLEAILVIAALAAFLVKTNRRDGLRYLYAGTGLAFLLGIVTWYVSANVVEIGGAGRELTEGLLPCLLPPCSSMWASGCTARQGLPSGRISFRAVSGKR